MNKRKNKYSLFKWKWIKFWGNYFKIVSPFDTPKRYYIYHKKIYDIDLWDKYFKSVKGAKKNKNV